MRSRKALELWEAFEKTQRRKEPPDYFKNLRIFEALYKEACHLGIFPLKDPLDGIELKVRLAKVIRDGG